MIYNNAKIDRKGRIAPDEIRLKPNASIYLLAGMELETGSIVIAKKKFMPEVPQGVTLPPDVLEEAGINPDSKLKFTCDDGTIIVQEADHDCNGDCEHCPYDENNE